MEFEYGTGMGSDGRLQIKVGKGYPWNPIRGASVCWYDCHEIPDTHPLFPMPLRHDWESDSRTWWVGKNEVFCTPNCCRAYNQETQKGDWQLRDNLIVTLARKCMGLKFAPENHVMVAPHRSLLKMFGGIMTIEQFRKAIQDKPPVTVFQMPWPMIAVAPVLAQQKPLYDPHPISAERIAEAKARVAARPPPVEAEPKKARMRKGAAAKPKKKAVSIIEAMKGDQV